MIEIQRQLQGLPTGIEKHESGDDMLLERARAVNALFNFAVPSPNEDDEEGS